MKTTSSKTVLEWLRESERALNASGDETARLDVLILLENCLGVNRANLLAYPEMNLTQTDLNELEQRLSERLRAIPMAYIQGRKEFYGRDFCVDPSVLIPRPESEAFIEEIKALKLKAGTTVSDIGTGSGNIGITIALEFPKLKVELYDISSAAINVAKKNLSNLNLSLPIHKSNLLSSLKTNPEVIVANLPYVPTSFELSPDAAYEPKLAIEAGPKGLDLYKVLWQQIKDRPSVKLVLTESLPAQHRDIADLAKVSGFKDFSVNDFVQVFKKI